MPVFVNVDVLIYWKLWWAVHLFAGVFLINAAYAQNGVWEMRMELPVQSV